MTKIGLIRVVSLEDRKIAELHGRLIERHYPMLQVISRCIKNQPKGIYDDETEALAIPKIIELGL
jgi:allantoin racemase